MEATTIHSPNWFVVSQRTTASLGQSALIPAVVFVAFATVIVLFRWYSKIRIAPGTWHAEDFIITCALILSIGQSIVVGIQYGLQMRHDSSTQTGLSRLSAMLKVIFAQSLLYQLSVNLVKTSFAFQYLRVFSHMPYATYYCYGFSFLILGATAWGVFGIIFTCSPIKTYWDVTVDGTCLNVERHFISTSIIGIVIDWSIWLLPMPIVRSLRLPRRQKWGLWAVFGLGGFVCIVSILRLTLVYQAIHTGEATKSGVYAFLWATIEVNVAIVCASLLVMKPLFAKWIPSFLSEQPISASEDKRIIKRLTGLAILQGGLWQEGKDEEQDRRDTGVEMDGGVNDVEIGGESSDVDEDGERLEESEAHESAGSVCVEV